MADWLKVEKATPDKPEIVILARQLGISQGEAFLSWFRVYSWADGITNDGRVRFLSCAEADTLSRAHPGTCFALASPEINWLSTKVLKGAQVIVFQRWDRHNSKSAKARALDTENKRKKRGKNCPDVNRTKTGLEKRRVEKKYRKGARPQDSEDFDKKVEAALEAKKRVRESPTNGAQGTG